MLVGKSAHSKQGRRREGARVLLEFAVFLHIYLYLYKTSHLRGFHNCDLTFKKKKRKLAVEANLTRIPCSDCNAFSSSILSEFRLIEALYFGLSLTSLLLSCSHICPFQPRPGLPLTPVHVGAFTLSPLAPRRRGSASVYSTDILLECTLLCCFFDALQNHT